MCSNSINPSGTEVKIFHVNYVNIMTDDALAPAIIRSSAAMVLTKKDKQVLDIHEGRIQLTKPSVWEEILEIAKIPQVKG